MSALLRFRDVACRRGGRLLFEELSFELKAGDALLLVGPNGSGKSSLIRLAAGLLAPASGEIERADPALADDLPALDPELALAPALRFWTGLRGGGQAVGEALATMGLDHLAAVPVRHLSSGQLRRASLARVAASGAPLWLLDEPLNGLDRDGRKRLEALIARHRQDGGAVLAASHGPIGGEWAQREIGA